MSSVAGIISKVDAVLNKVGPALRPVYLRTVTRVGADQLIGNPGTVTVVDTLLNPQPYYYPLSRQRIPGDHTRSEEALAGTSMQLLSDWLFLISPTAITRVQLSSPDLHFVLKDTSTTTEEDEVFRLIDVDAPMIYGGEALFQCYVRSVKR